MGAGVLSAMAVSGDRLPADERRDLVVAGRHYVDYALSFDRPDPLFGVPVRTLGSETAGGPYGQNRYWLENHQPDAPSVPYVGAVWAYLGLALLTSDEQGGRPWPTFAPPDVWPVLARSAEATLIMPDGNALVDFTPGQGIGFNVGPFPAWAMPCGEHRGGALYVDAAERLTPGRSGPRYVSEVGQPAGPSILLAGVPIIRLAIANGDWGTAGRWSSRIDRVLVEYTARPPDFEQLACKVAPWVSTSPAFTWAYTIGAYLFPWFVAADHRLGDVGATSAPSAPMPAGDQPLHRAAR